MVNGREQGRAWQAESSLSASSWYSTLCATCGGSKRQQVSEVACADVGAAAACESAWSWP